MAKRKAIIIGAGPAGLTAAYELLHRTDIVPVVFEQSEHMGGISRTANYKGNRIDIGGHRFFSKSDRVMKRWKAFMPPQGAPARDEQADGEERNLRPSFVTPGGPDPEVVDRVMLVRRRLSRIYCFRKLFDYPISLNATTVRNLGPVRIARIGLSYLRTMLFPIRAEQNLEDFLINRFGRQLYGTFFESYTEKVWGVPCRQIPADWGRQRIKGLSITKTLLNAVRKLLPGRASIEQKSTETSLIEWFLYPKLGPGQMWELTAQEVREKGGQVHTSRQVVGVRHDGQRVSAVEVRDTRTGEVTAHAGDLFFSTMPIKELVHAMGADVPADVREVAAGLNYRDHITVGVLVKRLKLKNRTSWQTANDLIPDNWIYVQEADVKMGRIQLFNNWSPYLVADPHKVWLGLEYFANEGDELWSKSDEEMTRFALAELVKIDVIDAADALDSVVIRTPKAYPAYFGTYDRLHEARAYLDGFENLFLLGRNGMHRYNNQDHSMLTAMTAVDNILAGITTKDNLWAVNAEQEYHEEKAEAETESDAAAKLDGQAQETRRAKAG